MITILFEFIALILGIIFYRRDKNKITKYFSYFLIYTIATELIGLYMGNVLHMQNHLPFNVYILFSFLFYYIFYLKIFKNIFSKKLIKMFIILFVAFYLVEFFVIKENLMDKLFNFSFVIGSIFLVIIIILFIIQTVNDEKLIFNFEKKLIFWISIGLLLFYIGTIPILISIEILNYNPLHYQILTFLNLIMYGCFSLGFILSKKIYNF